MAAGKSRAIGTKFVQCAVRANQKAVLTYLMQPVGGDEDGAIPLALPSGCLSTGHLTAESEMRTPKLLMRGLLFDALIARTLKRHAAAEISQAPIQAYPVAGSDPARATLRHDYRALMTIGDCAVRSAPEKVWSLLSAPVATPREEQAVVDLREAWTACLPGRHDLQFSTEMMRASLAEPFYKLNMALHQGAASDR